MSKELRWKLFIGIFIVMEQNYRWIFEEWSFKEFFYCPMNVHSSNLQAFELNAHEKRQSVSKTFSETK